MAQSPSATLVGTVRDPQHAVVPNATVVVRDLNTDEKRTVKTNAQGEYTVSDLDPSNYQIIISKKSFKQAEQPSVTLQAGQTARLDVDLQVGEMNEVVTVTAEVGLLNTETSDKGDVVSAVEISEMPLNGRDFNDLVFNIAGVAPAEEGTKGSAFVANGARSDATNLIIDGMNNTNPRDSTAEATPPLDALQEFKVQTSGFSAEYGRVAGPVINLVVKKGGNSLKGSIFEFVRNDLFDAGNYFDVPGSHSELRRNQFGATIGGPVYIPHLYNGHDKTFFLASEESFRQVQGKNAIGVVPSDLERAGNFTQSINTFTGLPLPSNSLKSPISGSIPSTPCYTYNRTTKTNDPAGYSNGNCLPSSFLNPITQTLMAYYPLSNYSEGANNYIVNKKVYQNWDTFIIKLDQQLASHDEASVRYLIRKETQMDPFSGTDLGTWASLMHEKQIILGFTETHMFHSFINEFRTGLTRQVHDEHSMDSGTDWDALLGIAGSTSDPKLVQFPSIKPTSYEALGDSEQDPVTYTTNNYDTNDTLTWNKGKHTVKLGASMLRTQYFQPTNTEFSGVINFNGRKSGPTKNSGNAFAEFLMGTPSSTGIRIGIVNNHLFDRNYAAFVQDDYKILDRLTLNLGLRYELQTLPTEEGGQLSSFVPSLQKVVVAQANFPNANGLPIVSAASAGLPQTLVHPNHLRFAPRLGWAWRPWINNQTVIRGSWGIFFTGSRLSVIRTELAGQFPFSTVQACLKTASPSTLVLAFNPLYCDAKTSTANGYDVNAPSSYLESYNLTVERELPGGTAIEIAYTGSRGLHLGRQIDINQANPALGICGSSGGSITYCRPYGLTDFNSINFFQFSAFSNYNGATVTFRKRFEHGLLFRLNYTYSKDLDLASGLNYSGKGGYKGTQDIFNQKAEYGRADSDRRHVFNGNFVYNLPFRRNIIVSGWEMAGSFQIDTGTPITPQYNGPTADAGDATRPNRVCDGSLPKDQRSVVRWFNSNQDATQGTVCFQQPTAPGTFGTSRRNIMDGPGLQTVTLALERNFRVTNTGKLQFRWEVFNVFNHPNLSIPDDYLDDAAAGTISTAKDPRVMQLGLKYSF